MITEKWITDNVNIAVTDKRTNKVYDNFTIFKANKAGIIKWGKIAHYNIVYDALKENKAVLNEVLADYPVLKKEDNSKKLKLAKAKMQMLKLRLTANKLHGIDAEPAKETFIIKESGSFGIIYKQFKDKPKEAIKHLKKVKQGECINALFRSDIGYIDIIWGENDDITNKGFGLKHIIAKHETEIKQMGFEVEDFIPIIVQFGNFNEKKSELDKKVYESKMFRFIVAIDRQISKNWLLTAFDLRKKPQH